METEFELSNKRRVVEVTWQPRGRIPIHRDQLWKMGEKWYNNGFSQQVEFHNTGNHEHRNKRSKFTIPGFTNVETKGRLSQHRDPRTSNQKVEIHNTGIHEHRNKRSKFTIPGFTNIETLPHFIQT